jgi:flavin reductase (DIM6/NTAB) family NADH-FMN oxidoreductase RutF
MSDSDAARQVFEAFVRALDTDILIVTAAAGAQRDGCVVGFHTQTSIDPSRLLVCLSDKNRTYRIAQAAGVLAVHLVPPDAVDLAALFGGETGDEVDKLAECAWHPGPGGAPVLERCPNWIAGRVLQRLPLGDHGGFLLDPVGGQATSGARGLRLSEMPPIEPGHEA